MARPTFEGISPTAFVSEYVRQGAPVAEFLRDFREAGGKISDRTAHSLYGEIQRAYADGEIAEGLRTDSIPRDEQYSPWSTKAGRGFATSIVYTRREVGTSEVSTARFLYTSSDPHAPDEAIQALYDTLTDDGDTDAEYGFEVLGAAVHNVFSMKPFEL